MTGFELEKFGANQVDVFAQGIEQIAERQRNVARIGVLLDAIEPGQIVCVVRRFVTMA